MSQDRLAVVAAAQVRQGGVVVISIETAALLARSFNLKRLRIAKRGSNPAIDADLMALHLAAMGQDVSGSGTGKAPVAEKPPESKWMGTPAAAGLLGVCTRTVTNALNRGDLRGRKVNGRWFITRTDIEQYRINRAA